MIAVLTVMYGIDRYLKDYIQAYGARLEDSQQHTKIMAVSACMPQNNGGDHEMERILRFKER